VFKFDLRFPGQFALPESGLYYNYYRDYDPTMGRYLESDPIGLRGGSYSTYAYVSDDPLRNLDPFGLQTMPLPAPAPIYVPSAPPGSPLNNAIYNFLTQAADNFNNNTDYLGQLVADQLYGWFGAEARSSDKDAASDLPSYARGCPKPSGKDKCGEWAEGILNRVFGEGDPRATARGPGSAYSQLKKACERHRGWWK